MIHPVTVLVWIALLAAGPAAPPAAGLVDVSGLDPRFRFDIRYATEDNFFGKKAYPEARCLLLREVADQIIRVQTWLDQNHAGYTLMFKDCYRPEPIQRVLYDAVRGTKKAQYVANPDSRTGSIHSYGAAVDLTLSGPDGREVDMGTPYDFLGKLAEPRYEQRFLKKGKLTRAQVQHRKILRHAMIRGGGFTMIRNEWWHFNAAPAHRIRKKYRRLSVPFSAVPRPDSK